MTILAKAEVIVSQIIDSPTSLTVSFVPAPGGDFQVNADVTVLVTDALYPSWSQLQEKELLSLALVLSPLT